MSSKGPVERSVYFEAGEEGGEVKLVPASEPRINLSGNMESFTVSFSFIIFPPFTFHVSNSLPQSTGTFSKDFFSQRAVN